MTFAEKITRAANTKGFLIFTAIVLALVLGFATVFSYRFGAQWIDSDHSSEMVLGQLLAAENKLVTSSWFYSNEIRLIYQTIFTMPLFKLLGRHENWALIRALNVLLNNIALVLSYLFLMKSMNVKARWGLITAIFLLMPLSVTYWTIVTFGGYYSFFIAQHFCCLGLFIKLAANEGAIKTKRIELILFIILSFALGLQGIRALVSIYVPLILACAYFWFSRNKKPGFPGAIGFIACCAGYAANGLLHKKYHFFSFGSTQIDNLSSNLLSKLARCFVNIAGYFGFTPGVPLFSVQGFFSIASIGAAFVLLWAVNNSITRIRHVGQADAENSAYFLSAVFLQVFFAASLALNIFVFIIVEQSIIARYFIPFMVLYIPLTAVFFEHAEASYKPIKRIALICAVILFIIGQGCLNFRSFGGWDINAERKGYVQYLLDNELRFGFATFWNANVTTELTNGKIEVAGLRPSQRSETSGMERNSSQNPPPYGIYEFLLPVKYRDVFYYTGESFLLLTSREWDSFSRRRPVSKVTPDYQDEDFVVIKYPSAEVVHREVLSR